jgi:hypothetical protein
MADNNSEPWFKPDPPKDAIWNYELPTGEKFTSETVPDDVIRKKLTEYGIPEEHIASALKNKQWRSRAGSDDPTVKAMGNWLGGIVPTIASHVGQVPGDVIDMLSPTQTAKEPDLRKTGGVPPSDPEAYPRSQTTNEALEQAAGGDLWHKDQSPFEEYLGAAAGGAATAIGSPGNAIAKMFAYGAIPALAGKAATDLVSSNTAKALGAGEKTKAAVGALAPLFTYPLARKAITPSGVINPLRLEAARTSQAEGGPTITAGQLRNDQRQVNRELRAQPNINDEQSEQFMRGITQHTGEPASDVTSGTQGSYIDRGLDRTSRAIEGIAQRSHIDPNVLGNGQTQPQVYNDLVNAQNPFRLRNPGYYQQVLNIIHGVDNRLTPTAGGPNAPLPTETYPSALFGSGPRGTGTRNLNGVDFNRIRSQLHATANEPGQDPQFAHHLRGVADILDNAMENTIQASGRPEDVGAWNEARRHYANMLVLEHAAAGAKAGQTRFSPDEIKSSTQSVMGTRPYLRGQVENSALTNSFGKFKPLETKDVPARKWLPPLISDNLPRIAGAGTVAAALYHGVPLLDTATPGILGYMMGEGGKRVSNGSSILPQMNPAVQGWKKNQYLPPHPGLGNGLDRAHAALIQALMASQRSQ